MHVCWSPSLLSLIRSSVLIVVNHMEEQQRLNQQHQDSYHQKSLRKHPTSDGRGGDDYIMSQETEEETRQLNERRKELLRRQKELIEEKRQIQREQEEISHFIQNQKEKLHGGDRDYDPPHYIEKESKVERFMKLANALYVCDQDQSGQ